MRPIESVWQKLLSAGRHAWPVYQRIDEIHPLDYYAGISANGLRILTLISLNEPARLPLFRAFQVTKGRREDGRWSISVELTHPEFAHIFGHLCDDLIEASRSECRAENAAAYFVARLLRWQTLLGRDRSGLLDSQEIRGLIGELLLLEQVVLPVKGPDSSVRSWEGPLGAPQDFRFEKRFIEVKTCGPSKPLVWISSAEQLDIGAAPITLAVCVIEPADPLVQQSFTLASLIARVRLSLGASGPALAALDERLKLAGYTDRPEYTADCFALREFRYYDVTDGFPKLERRLLPQAILSLTYQLDLTDCLSFEQKSVGF